jgi:hypothetical protein
MKLISIQKAAIRLDVSEDTVRRMTENQNFDNFEDIVGIRLFLIVIACDYSFKSKYKQLM